MANKKLFGQSENSLVIKMAERGSQTTKNVI